MTTSKHTAVKHLATLIGQAAGLSELQTRALSRATVARCRVMSPARALSCARQEARRYRREMESLRLDNPPGYDDIDLVMAVAGGATVVLLLIALAWGLPT